MYIQNRKFSLGFKLFAILLCITGQAMSYGLLEGEFNAGQLLYYTNQSNLLCLVYFILATVFVARSIREGGPTGPATFAPRFKGAVVMAITVTMLIYWFLLNGSGFAMDAAAAREITEETPMFTPGRFYFISNYIVHLIVPLMTILDWVLFDPKGAFHKLDPFTWLVIPLVYYAFALVFAQTGYQFYGGSRYPYFFIDSDALGWGMVAVFVGVLCLVFLAIGYLVFGADRLLAKRAAKSE